MAQPHFYFLIFFVYVPKKVLYMYISLHKIELGLGRRSTISLGAGLWTAKPHILIVVKEAKAARKVPYRMEK